MVLDLLAELAVLEVRNVELLVSYMQMLHDHNLDQTEVHWSERIHLLGKSMSNVSQVK